MRLIETNHLKTWAGSKSAESRFPHIVKTLICNVVQPDKIRFPSGDAVWVPGFDGIVVNAENNRFVPTGLSVWEVGTRAHFKDQANDNYGKRSRGKIQPPEKRGTELKVDRSEITFVFATPMVWRDKDAWIAERKNERIWKDIVVIDGVDLVDWLEVASAANLQFAAELALVPEAGLQTPEQAWYDWSYRTVPPASEELVVAGRQEQEKEFISRLSASPNTFTIRGDSPREAWGFALAVIRRIASDVERQTLFARVIVADNEEVAVRLLHLKNHIIVLKQARGQVSGNLSSCGCHVIIPEGNDAHAERNVIKLSRPTHRVFTEALEHMGLIEEEAERATYACGLSVTILQRQRAHANFERPRWADGQDAIRLLPALLAGRWNDHNEADRQILCHLAGSDNYPAVVSQLQDFLWVDEAPLQKIDEMWALTAPVDAFQLISRRLTQVHLDRFKGAFREVFGRGDPKVEIPPDEWIYCDIKGEQGYSGWLRGGMAETLLLIAERGADARVAGLASPQAYVDEVVRGLPGLNDDWKLLASLRDQYARLMEAAPVPFLLGIKQLLDTKSDDVRRLFAEGEAIFSGGGMHTGLLWALETLAWSPDFLSRVALILAKLASLDPGGKLANRPLNSLREIFLWWHPGTNAPLTQRLAALDLVLQREPEIGWQLLANLLPKAASIISHPTAKPRWRDFGDLPDDTRTRRGQFMYVSAIVNRALENVGNAPERWRAVLDSMGGIGSEQRMMAIARLKEVATEKDLDSERLLLWEILREFVYKHQTFKDASWALPKETVDEIESILAHLAPGDPVERNRWLFDEWLPELPSAEKSIESRKRTAEELRRQAVQEIFDKEGTQGIVRLGTSCKFPGWVAHASVPLIKELDELREFVHQAVKAGEAGLTLAGQISGRAHQIHVETWCEVIRKDVKAGVWQPAVAATLMVWWPDNRVTWMDAEAIGEEVKAEYWRRKNVYLIEGNLEDQIYQIDHLIETGRAAEVFDRIAHSAPELPSDVMLRVFDATYDEMRKAQSAGEIRRLGVDSYDMRLFLDQLRKRTDISRNELARREYEALPVLGSLNAKGLAIHEFIAEDPNFFVQVLCDVFLPSHRDKSRDTEPTPEEQSRAKMGFRLLEGMELIPGQREGDQIDKTVLIEWINAVRVRAKDQDRTAVADLKIGEILAHAPADPADGCWPHRAVREVIEELASEDIDRGLLIERRNMRGVFSKALYEGGAQERDLAKEYRGWADMSSTHWPRMARVLVALAEGWEQEGRREDARAEQDKLG